MTYPYRAAHYQYGPRKGTLGLGLHMSEGGDELVDYLARDPARGVSANFACLSTGVIWQMTPLLVASGSFNPADRSTDKGYYGHSTLVSVLGDHWPDPNAWTISIEIAGHAVVGPNDKQADAIDRWAEDMARTFPSIRGAFGHADQTDTKRCPGTTAAMKAVFSRIGGHGLWTQENDLTITITVLPFGGRYTIPAGASPKAIQIDATGKISATRTWPAQTSSSSADYDATVTISTIAGNPFLRCTDGYFAGWYLSSGQVTETPNPAPNEASIRAAQAEKDRTAVIAAVKVAIP